MQGLSSLNNDLETLNSCRARSEFQISCIEDDLRSPIMKSLCQYICSQTLTLPSGNINNLYFRIRLNAVLYKILYGSKLVSCRFDLGKSVGGVQ